MSSEALRTQISIENLVTGWNEIANSHRAALGDGWEIGRKFLQLHQDALGKLSVAAGDSPSEREQAVLLAGSHGHNLYVAALGLIARGQFDVAAHLVRGLFDAQALVIACGRHEDLAIAFLANELSNATARKRVVAEIRAAGEPDLADSIDRIYLDDGGAANELAHVGLVHADKLVSGGAGSITPVLGGREDAQEATRMARAIHQQEDRMLGWLPSVIPALDDGWHERQAAARDVYRKWMDATKEDDKS